VWSAVLISVFSAFLFCIIYWAIRDAKERKGSKVLAVILALLFFPLGLCIWLIIRPKIKPFDFAQYKKLHKKQMTENTKTQQGGAHDS